MSCGPGCPGSSASPAGGRAPSYFSRQQQPRPGTQQPRPGNAPRRPPSSRRPIAAVAPNQGAPISSPPRYNRGPELPRFPSPRPARMGPVQGAAVAPCIRPTPRLDATYTLEDEYPPVPIPNAPPFGETFVQGRDNAGILADQIMEDIGEEDEDWNVSTAVSVNEFPDGESGDDDDGEPCLPCNGPQLDDIGPDILYDSTEYLANATPPSFMGSGYSSQDIANTSPPSFMRSGYSTQEDSSLGILPDDLMQSQLIEMAEARSNISVFDAEELNRTTAPRNSDIDIPRTRIWQTLMNTLNETDNNEEEEFLEFIQGLQEQRREFIESSI